MSTISRSLLISFLFSVSNASAQELTMDSVGLLPGDPTTGQVLGKDAIPADSKLWPSTFTFKNSEGGACTATAVGEKAILTAAHCVSDGQRGTIATQSVTTRVTCQHHPEYPDNISADFALCLVDGTLPQLGKGFEIINVDPAQPKVGVRITLLGYGCLKPGGTDRTFGFLYSGPAAVRRLPENNSLFAIVSGGAAVCFGDSGGGAFTSDVEGSRKLFAVNARGDISQNSWLSATATSSFLNWARKWSADHNAQICGISASAKNCSR